MRIHIKLPTILYLALAVVAAFFFAGCAAQQYHPHPGSISTLDSWAADSLLEAQVTLCGTTAAGAQTCSGGLNHDVWDIRDAGLRGKAVEALRKATVTYNAAQASYKAYRAAATHTPADEQKLNDALVSLVADVAAAVRTFTGGKQ